MTRRRGPEEPADLYQVLGVDARVGRPAIVRAYRQLARVWHPDAQPGDPAAAARFRAITLAYEVLADPARRAAYDRARPRAGGPGTGGPGTGPGTGGPAARAAGSQRPSAGQVIPVRRASGRHPGERGGNPGGPPLWAGPVLVEPPGGPAARAAAPGPPAWPADGSGWPQPDLWSWWT